MQSSQSSSIIDTAPELLGMAELFLELPQSCSCPSLHTALTLLWHVRAVVMCTFLYIPPKGRVTYSQPEALDSEGEGLSVQLFAPILHPVHCWLPPHVLPISSLALMRFCSQTTIKCFQRQPFCMFPTSSMTS